VLDGTQGRTNQFIAFSQNSLTTNCNYLFCLDYCVDCVGKAADESLSEAVESSHLHGRQRRTATC